MSKFVTHVYATVRVKVQGTEFSNSPQEIAVKVADAVCAAPGEWMRPVLGSVTVDGAGVLDIEAVEFADGIYGVLVDELDPASGDRVIEHHFDETCSPRVDADNADKVIEEVIQVLQDHPEAQVGNAKVHFALMRLLSLSSGQ